VVTHEDSTENAELAHKDVKSEDTISDGDYSFSYKFESDRAHCQVDTLTLTGDDYTKKSESFPNNDGEYVLELDAPKRYKMGTYEWTMVGEAEGGASASISQKIRITRDC
jgi:hypothetical protein